MKKWLKKFITRHDLYQIRFMLSNRARAMKRFKSMGRGKRCFIMGGGPSLKKMDPKPLINEVTFGVNAIFLIQDWLGFLPTFYVVEDKLVVADRAKEISNMKGSHKFYDRRYNRLMPPDETTTNLRMLADYSDYPCFPEFSVDASRGVWCGGTVTYLCLQLAYFMEFDPVYLIGIDHSYTKPKHVQTEGVVWTSHGEDPNHFHPEYFGSGKRWHDPQVDRMEMAYKRSKIEFEKVGRRVLNATVGGRLEVFPRVNLKEIF